MYTSLSRIEKETWLSHGTAARVRKLIESECDVPSVPSVPNVPDVSTGPNVAAAAEPGVHFSRPLFCEVAD